jgi:hypothetical protein
VVFPLYLAVVLTTAAIALTKRDATTP